MKFGERLEFLETKFMELEAQNKTILLQLEFIVERLEKKKAGELEEKEKPEKSGSNKKLKPATQNEFSRLE